MSPDRQARRHFFNVMTNPYFQTDHYEKENKGGILEAKIYNFLKKIRKR